MAAPTTSRPQREEQLLAAAQGGDENAFGQLVEPYQRELQAHCYRMLGTVQDSEDALQDAMLRAWRALARFEGRSSLRSWLYKLATNTCLDLIAKRPKRVLPVDYGPGGAVAEGPGPPIESVWVEPYPDETLGVEDGLAGPEARYEQRESVELAFIAALQHLPARQRATLVLREVLGFSAKEVAQSMETTVPSVNSALQRARKAIDDRAPAVSQQETLRTVGDDEIRRIVEGYMEAWERGDVNAVAQMLTEDAVISMPPMASWYRGPDVLEFLSMWAFSGRLYNAEGNRRVRVIPARAGGQLAFGTYSWDEERQTHLPTVLQVLTLDGPRIAEVIGFVTPEAFGRFDLPAAVPA